VEPWSVIVLSTEYRGGGAVVEKAVERDERKDNVGVAIVEV
jgi:hypothetical protein